MGQVLPLVTRQGDRIAIVSGLRTPFARQATAFHGIPAGDLGKMVVGELLARSEIPGEVIEQLVFGQVVQMPEAPNIARDRKSTRLNSSHSSISYAFICLKKR